MVRHSLRLAFGLMFSAVSLSAQADLVVLQYHHISDTTPSSTSTSVSLFKGQLKMITDQELEVVALQEGTEAALRGELNDRKQIAITFDDAYDSVFQQAAPLLEQRDYPYTIFVNTDAVGGQGYMTWDQLRQLNEQERVTIANHSHDHGHLARRPDESRSDWETRVENSLDQAQSILQDQLGIAVPMFAYPYGEFDTDLEAKLSERGWIGYGQQSGAVGSTSGITRLPRFPMANAYGQLGNLRDKLMSKALPIDANELPDGVLSDNPPTLEFQLPDTLSVGRLTCFASGQGRIDIEELGEGAVRIQAPRAFDSRRFRYNCTHPADDGSYYWLSQQWLDLQQPED